MDALYDCTTGTKNCAFGSGGYGHTLGALGNCTTGSQNAAFGYRALATLTTANDNCAFGHQALKSNTTGSENSAFGREALRDNATSTWNTAIGMFALRLQNGGTGYNTAIGGYAMTNCTSGNNNTALGFHAGREVTTGTMNVFLGRYAGSGQVTTGDNTLWIARDNVGNSNAACWIFGNAAGACLQGNNSSSWGTSSDRRLKKDIVDSPKGLAEIKQLRVTNFKYRNEDEIDMSEFPIAERPDQVVLRAESEGELQTGIIAQEIEEVLPECVEVSEKGVKTVNNDPITWAMINAIKELSAKNDALEARLAAAGIA